jgi:hypothetical protein
MGTVLLRFPVRLGDHGQTSEAPMNKRQFFTKTLLASRLVAADMLHAAPDVAAAENVHERIASFAGKSPKN